MVQRSDVEFGMCFSWRERKIELKYKSIRFFEMLKSIVAYVQLMHTINHTRVPFTNSFELFLFFQLLASNETECCTWRCVLCALECRFNETIKFFSIFFFAMACKWDTLITCNYVHKLKNIGHLDLFDLNC